MGLRPFFRSQKIKYGPSFGLQLGMFRTSKAYAQKMSTVLQNPGTVPFLGLVKP